MAFFSALKSLLGMNRSKDTKHITFQTSIEIKENEIHPLVTKKTEIGLTPGEIILLNWCNGTSEDKLFPQYFKYNYNINGSKSVKELLNKGFLEYGAYSDQLNALTVKELKEALSNNNITVKGRKENLIHQIIEANIIINELPKTYILTFEGRETLRDYEYIVLAHKDSYFDVLNAIIYREQLPYPYGYGDLKWSYLNDQSMKHIQDKEFGLLRNIYLAQADHLEKESKYSYALSFYILVVIVDVSGLGNNYKSYNKPFYDNACVVPRIFEFTETVIEKGSLSKEDYNKAFNHALRFFNPLQSFSFLTDKDIEYLREKIFSMDLEVIEEYLKKYKELTYKGFIDKRNEKYDQIMGKHSKKLLKEREDLYKDYLERNLMSKEEYQKEMNKIHRD